MRSVTKNVLHSFYYTNVLLEWGSTLVKSFIQDPFLEVLLLYGDRKRTRERVREGASGSESPTSNSHSSSSWHQLTQEPLNNTTSVMAEYSEGVNYFVLKRAVQLGTQPRNTLPSSLLNYRGSLADRGNKRMYAVISFHRSSFNVLRM